MSKTPEQFEQDDVTKSVEKSFSELQLGTLPPYHAYPIPDGPLLLYYQKCRDGNCNYYSPMLHKSFSVRCPLDLSGTSFRYASSGWLLLSHGSFELLLVNPFTGVSHKIPDLDAPLDFSVMAFSIPNDVDTDLVVFGLRWYGTLVYIQLWHGEGDWSPGFFYNSNESFTFSESNPVYHHGLFYCLGMTGNLATFDPSEYVWTVLDKPGPVSVADDGIDECFLLESKGELYSVFIEKQDKYVNVFRLDQANMEWEEVSSLEDDQAFFVGYPVTLESSRAKGNRVYLPRVHGEPEMIPAEVKEFGGRMFFVPKSGKEEQQKQSEEAARDDEGSLCYFPLDTEEEFKIYKSKGYMFSIWFEPKFT